MEPLPEFHAVTPERFARDVRARREPAVLRGLVADWPLVRAGTDGPEGFLDCLRALAGPGSIDYVEGLPAIEGRFHYDAALRGFNFASRSASLAAFADRLSTEARVQAPAALAAQGIVIADHLPNFRENHAMPLLPRGVAPRLWLGNRVRVAIHNDPAENIACVVAGRRRFTVFPPEQLANLYMGPFHFTPAGTPVSMVHLTAPDVARYPRFAQALAAGQTAELAPGDAIYIPYQWFHHVESLDPVSALVNYWWDPARPDLGAPHDVLLHAMAVLRQLPPDQRRSWRAYFDHYAFETTGDAGAHLPEHARGALGARVPADVAQMRAELLRRLMRG